MHDHDCMRARLSTWALPDNICFVFRAQVNIWLLFSYHCDLSCKALFPYLEAAAAHMFAPTGLPAALSAPGRHRCQLNA